MNAKTLGYVVIWAGVIGLLGGCRSGGERNEAADPDPQMRRALAESRAGRSGDVRPSGRRRANGPRSVPGPDAVQADVILVGDDVLTVDEVLYPLRDRLQAMHASGRTSREQLTRLVTMQAQQELGTLLLYQEATKEFDDSQRGAVATYVEREVGNQIARAFGGSQAKFEKHLAEYGLTIAQYRDYFERWAVTQRYGRERFMPQVHVRRDELLAEFRKRQAQDQQEETRELWLIALPFAEFLPEGVGWDAAEPAVRAAAQATARAQAQAAVAQLSEQDFADVAREFSKGVMAVNGGNWGQIGRPLQPPLDEVSARVFKLDEGAHTEPIETETGVYIVGCGEIRRPERVTFADVQAEIKQELEDRRLGELSQRHMMALVEQASLSSLQDFINAAVRRASNPNWPAGR